jgi:hypothetical protein
MDPINAPANKLVRPDGPDGREAPRGRHPPPMLAKEIVDLCGRGHDRPQLMR